MAHLEHVNITVFDPKKTAAMLSELFGWHTRWEGASMDGQGYTVHVGNGTSYIAVYSGSNPTQTVPKVRRELSNPRWPEPCRCRC